FGVVALCFEFRDNGDGEDDGVLCEPQQSTRVRQEHRGVQDVGAGGGADVEGVAPSGGGCLGGEVNAHRGGLLWVGVPSRRTAGCHSGLSARWRAATADTTDTPSRDAATARSEEHTSELQSRF